MFIPGQEEGGATEYAKPFVNSVCAYDYDEFNQLIKTSASGAVTTYAYNGDGLRVEKDENGKITRYLYEGDKVVLELDDKGYQTARNVQGINLISRTASGTIAYYFYNGHADVTTLLDKTGAKLASYYYDAFGNITESSGSMKNPYRYAGYQYDEGTGLYYLNARYYDPETARFISEDTYRGEPKDPLSLNLYTYCHNEPVMYDDPTGHREVIDVDAKVQYIPQNEKTVVVNTRSSAIKSSYSSVKSSKAGSNGVVSKVKNVLGDIKNGFVNHFKDEYNSLVTTAKEVTKDPIGFTEAYYKDFGEDL